MGGSFVAVNYIGCRSEYRERFETLFASRAHAIDRIEGFVRMRVLRPLIDGEDYLVVSEWEGESAFKSWLGSSEFEQGHSRAFADMRSARERGEEAPMSSRMVTYSVVTD